MYLKVRLWSAFQMQKGLWSRENTFQTALNQQGPRSLPHEATRAGFSVHCGFFISLTIFSSKRSAPPPPFPDFLHITHDMSNVHICSEATVFSCSLQGHYMHGAIVQRNGVLFKCQERTLHNAREPRSPGGSFSGGKHAELTPPWQLIQEVLFQEEGE